ncbi:TetR/AcrR family transcriptional regulator [Pseudooceanicola sp.]
MPGKRRKAQILEAATQLFAEMGYEGTALRDVAESCGMTKAALYYHFADKEALLRAVVEMRMSRMIDMMEMALGKVPQDQPVERIRAFVRASANHIDHDRAGWVVGSRIFWSIEAPIDRTAVVELRDRYEGLLRAEIEKGIAAGLLAERDPGMMARMILSWLNYIPRWHRLDGQLSSAEIADQFLDMTLDGVRPR